MLNRIFVVDSVTLTSTGAAVSSYVPWEQSTRKLPTQVVIKATGQGAYVRLSNDNSAATNADTLVQAGDHVVLSVQGRRWVSVLSDGASSTVNVGALSTGVSGSAASLELAFVDAGVLDPRVTFTRASTATYFNSAGVLTSAAINEARFDYNPATLAARGLLIEEQRTNLALYSAKLDQFASPLVWALTGANATLTATTDIAAPDGTMTAWTLTSSGATAQIQQSTTVVASTTYTGSFWIRRRSGTGTVNIRVVENVNTPLAGVTSQWQRFTFTATSTTTTGRIGVFLSGTSDAVDIWGAQLEAGAFPTSYIPTTTTALTRSADVASVNTLAPWFNAAAGTIYAEFSIPAATASRSQATFGDGTANERMIISNNTSLAGTSWRIVDGGVDQADISNITSFANNATVKVAGAYAVNDFATCQGGGAVGTDTSGTLPTVTTLYLGSNGVAQYASFYLRRITYYPRRLSNAELQAITA